MGVEPIGDGIYPPPAGFEGRSDRSDSRWRARYLRSFPGFFQPVSSLIREDYHGGLHRMVTNLDVALLRCHERTVAANSLDGEV